MTAPAMAGGDLLRRILGFTRLARGNGFRVGIAEGNDALAFAAGGAMLDATAFHAGLRALFCSCRADWRRFDDLFDAYWHGHGMRQGVLSEVGRGRQAGAAAAAGSPAGPGEGSTDTAAVADGGPDEQHGASSVEVLGRTDLRHLDDPDELQRAYDLAERLAARMRRRATRRRRLHRRGRVIDLRHTIHRSLRHGGTPLELAFRKRRVRPRRLVVLLDVSGSMNLYSTFFMRFVRGIVENFAEAEAFVFHTRLVHVSHILRERNIEKAIDRMNVMSAGWGGGTRLGMCLKTFNDGYAKAMLNRRSVVIIFSDGYDTGDPELLGDELARIRKRAGRIVWLNPLLGWAGYEPVARGMAAALPYLDLFAPAHNLDSLAAIEPELCRL